MAKECVQFCTVNYVDSITSFDFCLTARVTAFITQGQFWHDCGPMVYCATLNFTLILSPLQGKKSWKTWFRTNLVLWGSYTTPLTDQGQIWHARADPPCMLTRQIWSKLACSFVLEGKIPIIYHIFNFNISWWCQIAGRDKVERLCNK